jgi:NADPH-dependent 2,4-dienoyl-CoA reductase/sulfur reductase-like enzyme
MEHPEKHPTGRQKMKQLCQTDVLVVGGGMAGVGAALAAARAGKETITGLGSLIISLAIRSDMILS